MWIFWYGRMMWQKWKTVWSFQLPPGVSWCLVSDFQFILLASLGCIFAHRILHMAWSVHQKGRRMNLRRRTWFFFFFEISMASNFPATSFSAAYFLRKSWDNLKVPAGVIKPSWKDSWKPAICVLFLLFHRITLLLQVVKLLFTWWDLLRTHEADHIARRILRRCRCKTSLLIRGGSSLGYIVHAVGNTKELIARDGPAIDPAF